MDNKWMEEENQMVFPTRRRGEGLLIIAVIVMKSC